MTQRASQRQIAAIIMVFGSGFFSALVARADETPTADCLTASSASIRLDNEHRLRAERAQLLVCASASCPVDVRNECIRRVDEINSAIPTIIFAARDSLGNDLSAVRVTMDAELLTDRLQGISIPIDPGVHTFIFDAPAQASVWKSFVILQGQKNRTEVVTFAAAAAPPPLADASARSTGSDSSHSGLPSSPSSSSPSSSPATDGGTAFTAQQKWAVALATAGVAGLGIGAAFGWQARTKRDDARAVCPATCTDQRGVDRWQEAKRAGNFSTAAFVAGGIGLAGATLLWLTATPAPAVVAGGDRPGPQASRRLQLGVVADGASSMAVAIGGRW